MIVAKPIPTPITCGWRVGVVAPWGTTTLDGVTTTFEVSLLSSVTVTPPVGAGVDRVTRKDMSAFGVTFMVPGATDRN